MSQPAPSPTARRGWYLYDWASSPFLTTVVVVFGGPYLTGLARAAADSAGFVYPLGVPVRAAALYPFTVALSAIVQVLLLPVVGGIADATSRSKPLLALFAYLGALATVGLYLAQGAGYAVGALLFIVASVAYGGSFVVYNAYLPRISSPEQRAAVSSRGWALGYLAAGLVFAANVALVRAAPGLGLTTEHAVRLSLASAGVWWAVFTTLSLRWLPDTPAALPRAAGTPLLLAGFQQVVRTVRHARAYPQTLLFLGAYLLFNDGIQTVVATSAQFAQEELGVPVASLSVAILLSLFLSIGGTLLFGAIARRIGSPRALVATLVIWSGLVLYAFALLRTEAEYFLLTAISALVIGSSQALSRTVYTHLVPRGQEAAYFGLYEVTAHGTSWLGPLLFGLALQFTGSYRVAVLSLVVFFVGGLLLLLRTDVRRGARDAGNTLPERP